MDVALEMAWGRLVRDGSADLDKSHTVKNFSYNIIELGFVVYKKGTSKMF